MLLEARAAARCEAAESRGPMKHAQGWYVAQHTWDEECNCHHAQHDDAGPVKHVGCAEQQACVEAGAEAGAWAVSGTDEGHRRGLL